MSKVSPRFFALQWFTVLTGIVKSVNGQYLYATKLVLNHSYSVNTAIEGNKTCMTQYAFFTFKDKTLK